jgi:hypothetical protein
MHHATSEAIGKIPLLIMGENDDRGTDVRSPKPLTARSGYCNDTRGSTRSIETERAAAIRTARSALAEDYIGLTFSGAITHYPIEFDALGVLSDFRDSSASARFPYASTRMPPQ